MRELVTPEQLAAELGITEKTLSQWRYRGTGPAYIKLGGNHRSAPVRYRRADVNRWLDAQPVIGGKAA